MPLTSLVFKHVHANKCMTAVCVNVTKALSTPATIEFYKSTDSFDKVECCFDIVAVFRNNVAVLATISNEISSFPQSRNKLNMFNLLRLCRKKEILQ